MVSWHEFFGALSVAFGSQAPLLIFGMAGIVAFGMAVILLSRILAKFHQQGLQEQAVLKDISAALSTTAHTLEVQRQEFRETAAEHRAELKEVGRGMSETVLTMRTMRDELRASGISAQDAFRQLAIGIERVIAATIRKARGEDPC